MSNYNSLANMAALVQRDIRASVATFRPEQARTLATFETGTRSEEASLAGLQIPYKRNHAHGQTNYSPLEGDTSFSRSHKQKFGAMFAGVVFRNMNMHLESHHIIDMNKGKIPHKVTDERRDRISTHMMKKNWAAIGNGDGTLAWVSSCVGATLTCLANNSARGTSKGVFRLKESDADDPLLYSGINSATDAEVARFYVTAKLTSTTATVVFTVGNAAALNVANLRIVEYTMGWKKELIGVGGHISDQARIYQGADTSVDTFLQNPGVNGGNVAVTPSAVHTAKGIMMTRANCEDEFGFVCHLTWGNYRTLAKFGYTARVYNDKSMTTWGVPNMFEDGDTVFVPDADYEDAYVDFRERAPYFEYVQKEFGLKTVDGISRHEWAGNNGAGSTEEYENHNETCNIVWDGRGKDGKGKRVGSPNSAVFIYNLAIPTESQATYGV